MKLTGNRLFTNISDTGKAFLIILLSDIFLGYDQIQNLLIVCNGFFLYLTLVVVLKFKVLTAAWPWKASFKKFCMAREEPSSSHLSSHKLPEQSRICLPMVFDVYLQRVREFAS